MKGQSEERLMDKRHYLFTLTFGRDVAIDVLLIIGRRGGKVER